MPLLKNIKNIIFDFGGVIINIDYNLTINRLKDLGITNFDDHYTKFSQSGLFDKLDTGMISGDDFITELASLYEVPPSRQELIDAWNAMLLDFPPERAELLKKLKTKYRTFLLSNTNEIHLNYYFKKLKEWFDVENMSTFVHREYYSCYMHLRKPDIEIFQYVIRENNLNPSETLFIDDSLQHVEGAAKAGLRAFHLEGGKNIVDIFRT